MEKGSQRPNGPWAGLNGSGRRESCFGAPPWEGPWNLIWRLKAIPKGSRRGFDQGADAECSKKLFLKDVLNEITSFDGSLDAQYLPKTAQNVHWDL